MTRIAIVHDYLNQRGGAERVALAMSDIWPEAPIYTSLYRPDSTFPEFKERDIRTSPLDRIPVDGSFRGLFPLYAPAFRAFGRIDADVVISSSSGWAHMVRTVPDAVHMVYCHNPARWLYGGEYLMASQRRKLAEPIFPLMRLIDRRAAKRADIYVANSQNVAARIRSTYGRDARVLPPPVDVENFSPRPGGDRLLVVSRLLPYKRVDLVIEAAARAGLALDIVGNGPKLLDLQRRAGANVTFHQNVPQETLVDMMESSLAVCVPGAEDFGIVSVEAQAAGKPVIAYAEGGSLETVIDGTTGALFAEPTVDSLLDALSRALALTTPAERIAQNAAQFSADAFRTGMLSLVSEALARGEVPQAAEAPAILRAGWRPEGD